MTPRSHMQQGMALVAVLWMVAALGIIAGGLLTSVKGEIRVAAHQKQLVVAGALADGAIRRVLQDISAHRPPVTRPIYIDMTLLHGFPVSAVVQPLNGLIDINNAPEALLAALFQRGEGLSPNLSSELARAVVNARGRRDARGRSEGFDAPEDLLRVPGIDYPLYATIAPLVSASLSGSGLVNPQAAPPAVLAVLSQGNAVLASQLAVTRDSSRQPMDTTLLNQAFVETAPATTLQVSARVPLADGAALVKTWWVNLSSSAQTGLPWQVLESRQHLVPGGG